MRWMQTCGKALLNWVLCKLTFKKVYTFTTTWKLYNYIFIIATLTLRFLNRHKLSKKQATDSITLTTWDKTESQEEILDEIKIIVFFVNIWYTLTTPWLMIGTKLILTLIAKLKNCQTNCHSPTLVIYLY